MSRRLTTFGIHLVASQTPRAAVLDDVQPVWWPYGPGGSDVSPRSDAVARRAADVQSMSPSRRGARGALAGRSHCRPRHANCTRLPQCCSTACARSIAGLAHEVPQHGLASSAPPCKAVIWGHDRAILSGGYNLIRDTLRDAMRERGLHSSWSPAHARGAHISDSRRPL